MRTCVLPSQNRIDLCSQALVVCAPFIHPPRPLPAAARLDALGAEWAQRSEADKAAWEAERHRLVQEAERRLAEAEAAHAAGVEEVAQLWRCKLAAAEAQAEARVLASDK